MTYPGFALGLRVIDDPHEGLRPDDYWELLFGWLTANEAKGMELFIADPPPEEEDPEPVYICIFANMSLSCSQRLYARIVKNKPLCSYLTVYRPFVQNNYLMRCPNVRRLGYVGPKGAVEGGSISFGSMCFSGPTPKDALIRLRFLLAPCGFAGVSPVCAARRLVRAVAARFPDADLITVPLTDGGAGALDALISARGGRYVRCITHDTQGRQISAAYALLSDYSAVIEAAQTASAGGEPGEALYQGSYGTGELLRLALDAGCTSVYLAIGGGTVKDDGEGFMRALGIEAEADDRHVLVDAERMHPGLKTASITVLSDARPDGGDATKIARHLRPFARVEEASAVETVMKMSSFDCKLRETTVVFTGLGGEGATDERASIVTDRIAAHCKKYFTQMVRVRMPESYDTADAPHVFEQAAHESVQKMRFENWFISLTSEIVPVSGEKRK